MKPTKHPLLLCTALGAVVQLPALALLIRRVFDMHNNFSTTAAVLLPYAAIVDRQRHLPSAVVGTVFILTLVQFVLYGVIVGLAWRRDRVLAAVSLIAGLHACAAIAAIYVTT